MCLCESTRVCAWVCVHTPRAPHASVRMFSACMWACVCADAYVRVCACMCVCLCVCFFGMLARHRGYTRLTVLERGDVVLLCLCGCEHRHDSRVCARALHIFLGPSLSSGLTCRRSPVRPLLLCGPSWPSHGCDPYNFALDNNIVGCEEEFDDDEGSVMIALPACSLHVSASGLTGLQRQVAASHRGSQSGSRVVSVYLNTYTHVMHVGRRKVQGCFRRQSTTIGYLH